jgi:hypothetical protein
MFSMVSKRSGKCLNVEGAPASTANGAHVIQSDCGGHSANDGRIEVSEGVYQLVAQHSNECLNVDGGGTANGVHLQWGCTGVAWEQWCSPR